MRTDFILCVDYPKLLKALKEDYKNHPKYYNSVVYRCIKNNLCPNIWKEVLIHFPMDFITRKFLISRPVSVFEGDAFYRFKYFQKYLSKNDSDIETYVIQSNVMDAKEIVYRLIQEDFTFSERFLTIIFNSGRSLLPICEDLMLYYRKWETHYSDTFTMQIVNYYCTKHKVPRYDLINTGEYPYLPESIRESILVMEELIND